MSPTHDHLATLDRLAPRTAVDAAWPSTARAAAYQRVVQAAAGGDGPAAARPSRRRRLLVATAVTAVLVPSSVGAATASGVLPVSFLDQLSFWTTETSGDVIASNARRVAQLPGPGGRVLSVWAARGTDGYLCLSGLYEAPGPLNRPAPADPEVVLSTCPSPSQYQDGNRFGAVSGSGGTGSGLTTAFSPAGAAVRAELELPDGSVRPAMAAEGYFFFWYQADRAMHAPVLVGYDDAGEVLDRVQLNNFVTNPHLEDGVKP